VVGRVKDHINRGGEKIPAPEVEGHLLAHPLIDQAALVGLPDTLLGEKPVAVLACSGKVPTVADIAQHLRDRGVARYKFPTQVETVASMPLTPVGKIDKAALIAGIGEDAR
jgi:non-ribosomal peptide synthetase component E (peptide arylation enzyme)